jgi:hypothetical protein
MLNGMEMMLKAMMPALLNKLDVPPEKLAEYKANLEFFFKSHGLLVQGVSQLLSEVNALKAIVEKLEKNAPEPFVCQNCGATHEPINGSGDDSGDSRTE